MISSLWLRRNNRMKPRTCGTNSVWVCGQRASRSDYAEPLHLAGGGIQPGPTSWGRSCGVSHLQIFDFSLAGPTHARAVPSVADDKYTEAFNQNNTITCWFSSVCAVHRCVFWMLLYFVRVAAEIEQNYSLCPLNGRLLTAALKEKLRGFWSWIVQKKPRQDQKYLEILL